MVIVTIERARPVASAIFSCVSPKAVNKMLIFEMCISILCARCDDASQRDAESTQRQNLSQEKNTQKKKSGLVPGFGDRFLRAFGDLKQAEIAVLLNVRPSAITNYTKDRVPKPHILVKMWEHTHCDLHWLLTGERLPSPPPVPLENGEKEIIENLAQTTNQTVDQVLRKLLIEALENRGLVKPRHSPSMLVFRPDLKLVAVPLIGAISAGQPIKYYKEHRNVMVAEVFILPHDGYQFCILEIVGNDVDEGLAHGDYIICCDNKKPESGQVVVASIDGATPTVKRIFFEGANIRLQPITNKSPGEVYPAEKVEIIYTVTGVQHNP